jgi:capsular polysaccharide biosynthesis protein
MNQNSSGQPGPQDQINDWELSLLDIFIFFKQSYKLIAVIGTLGVIASFSYLLIAPKQYEVSVLIQMAKIGNPSNNNNSINPLGISIEEPSLLIARLSYPSIYTAEIVKVCGLGSLKDAQEVLYKSVKLTIPKDVGDVINLKIIGISPEVTFNCVQAVFNLIKTTQDQMAMPYIEEAKAKLLDNQERLAKAKDFLVKADNFRSAMSAAHIATQDEVRFLLDEIRILKNVIATNDKRPTRLVAPIYASDDPIAPKKLNVLLSGLFGGLFLGLLFSFWRQIIRKLKEQLENNTIPK